MTKLFCDKCGKEIGSLITVSITARDPEYPISNICKNLELCYDCGKKFEEDFNMEIK